MKQSCNKIKQSIYFIAAFLLHMKPHPKLIDLLTYMSTDFGRRAFSYSSPATWNSIPTSIKNCSSLYSFQRHLQSQLIAQLIRYIVNRFDRQNYTILHLWFLCSVLVYFVCVLVRLFLLCLSLSVLPSVWWIKDLYILTINTLRLATWCLARASDSFSMNDYVRVINFCIIIIIIIWPRYSIPTEEKIMLCKDKRRKQAGMVFTPPPPSQNYQEVE